MEIKLIYSAQQLLCRQEGGSTPGQVSSSVPLLQFNLSARRKVGMKEKEGERERRDIKVRKRAPAATQVAPRNKEAFAFCLSLEV